ncbi:N-acetylglucosamine related transporter, NagX [hydrothermal vent metagenome]|uniref:N-acetylglucosamine related transporter, NagX n=1 Tax=hydrothermal vent metagenome TaxID=652676 RepID=A0A3B1CYT2_9ZZZZ
MNSIAKDENKKSSRLLSLDAFRGFTMWLLIAEFAGLFHYLVDPSFNGTIIGFLGEQFNHHEWHGLHFWDLVQPYFMFIVGVAIPFSERNRLKKGSTDKEVFRHALVRSALLLLLGWALYCIGPGRIVFRFQNVLAQLSVTYLVAFLLRNKSIKLQLAVSIAFIAVSELLYRTFWVPGFDLPFTPDHNFGAWFDMLISGELSRGHWVSFNAIPTTAHTIWGVIIGKILLSGKPKKEILKIMIISGVVGLVVGYALNPITPIIKRISTSSFVFVSGGWSLLTFALFYWVIDMKDIRKWARFAVVVGINPLFIYLFAHVGGGKFIAHILKPFTFGLFGWMGELNANIILGILTWYFLWYITYWLDKRKIYIKI